MLKNFNTALSAFDKSIPTYDLFRKMVRLAVQNQVPKTLCSNGSKAYIVAITPEVEQFLHTVTRGTPPYEEFAYVPAPKYRIVKPVDNEVGAMHEIRFFLASDYDKPNLIKFVTDLGDSTTIKLTDDLVVPLDIGVHSVKVPKDEYKQLLLDSLELSFLTEALQDMPTDYSELIDTPEYNKAVEEINSKFKD